MEKQLEASNNLMEQFNYFIVNNEVLLEKLKNNNDVIIAANLLYSRSIANFGEIYLTSFITFGLFLAADWDKIFGEPIPKVFVDFLSEIQNKNN